MHFLYSVFTLFLPLFAYASYDYQIAKTSLFLSGAAYCGKDAYQSILAGPASGFDVSTIIYDSVTGTDLQRESKLPYLNSMEWDPCSNIS